MDGIREKGKAHDASNRAGARENAIAGGIVKCALAIALVFAFCVSFWAQDYRPDILSGGLTGSPSIKSSTQDDGDLLTTLDNLLLTALTEVSISSSDLQKVSEELKMSRTETGELRLSLEHAGKSLRNSEQTATLQGKLALGYLRQSRVAWTVASIAVLLDIGFAIYIFVR